MDKTKFLEAARKKYIAANAKVTKGSEFVSEMNFIFSDKLILRVWHDPKYNPNNKHGDTGARHRWCTVVTLPMQKNAKIIKAMGNYLAGTDGNDEAIIDALREALKERPNDMVEDVEYTEEDGINTSFISMWEPLEGKYTVQEFCDLVGIK